MRGRFPFLGAPALSVYPVLADSPSSSAVRLVMQARRFHLARLSLTRGEGRKKQHIGRKFESFVTVFSPVVVGSVDSRSLVNNISKNMLVNKVGSNSIDIVTSSIHHSWHIITLKRGPSGWICSDAILVVTKTIRP